MKKIIISIGQLSFSAELFNTPSAEKIFSGLPLEGRANRWGDEIYFTIPLTMKLEPNARTEVDVGELGYWPQGPAFCIFFGPTPVSTDERPRAYSPVNVFGRIIGDVSGLKTVDDGAEIVICPEK